jgi:hypothetical protein
MTKENPLATAEQRELEDTALRILARPELKRSREVVAMLWRQAVAYPARDQMSRFENMIDEYMFNYTVRAVNSDANYPKAFRHMAPAHHWFGRDVPGSRWGGDSPDFIYRLIPIGHGGRYEIRCVPGDPKPTMEPKPTVGAKPAGGAQRTCEAKAPGLSLQLLATRAAPVSMGVLESVAMTRGPDGEYVVTIDDTAADGRTNHLQTKPGVDHVLLRDELGDWIDQTPYAVRVQRLNAPERAPLSDDELAQRAAQLALDSLYYTYYTTRSGAGQAPNAVRVPVSSRAFGGMPTQWGTKGNLVLEEDEALIATANAAGAEFRNTMLTDLFHMSINYWSSTSSLNMLQMAPDQDGRFTYVVAHQDPGVHNWLNTNGLRRTIFGHRWQAIPDSYRDAPGGETPTIAVRVVKFKELDKELPAGVARIDAKGREKQLAARAAGFKRRFVDR